MPAPASAPAESRPRDGAARFEVFDLVRGLAALAVCAGHLRGALLADGGGGVPLNALERALYFATALGHEAVMVFFVLSGYFVGGQVLRARSDFSPARYAAARLSRLWVVLVPALALTALIDDALLRLDPAALQGAHYGVWLSGPVPGHYAADGRTLLANLAFSQTIIAPVFGSNGPLWSLANEFWYYVLFPTALLAAGYFPARRTGRERVLAALVLAAALWWVPTQFLRGFVLWMLGALLAALAARDRLPALCGTWAARVVAGALFVGALMLSNRHRWSSEWLHADDLVGVSFALFAATLVRATLPWAWLRRAAVGLSEISYSLYLCHLPVVLLISLGCYGGRELVPSFAHWMIYAGWLLALVGFAVLFWAAFERHTPRVRRWLARDS